MQVFHADVNAPASQRPDAMTSANATGDTHGCNRGLAERLVLR
jgi:hypothetical protein